SPQRKAGEEEDDQVRQRDLAWARFDAAAKAQESTWTRSTHAQLRRDREAVLELFDEELKTGRVSPERKADDEIPADPEAVRRLIQALAERLEMSRAWEETLQPLVESTGESAVISLAAELGLSFELLQPGLLEYVQREA